MRRVALDAPITRSPRRALRDTRPLVLPATATHGQTGYQEYGCRCDVCTDAIVLVQRRVKARQRGELAPVEHRGRTHGLISTYNSGCRCEECKAASRDHRARMRANARARDLSRQGKASVACGFCGEPILVEPKGDCALVVHERACAKRDRAGLEVAA